MADKKLGIIVIHGMGAPSANYANKMIREINRRVRRKKKSYNKIAWKVIHWSPITEDIQDDYIANAKIDNNLDFNNLREFIIQYLGDASAYQPLNDMGIYNKINSYIQKCVSELYNELGKKDLPMILLAHSLGAHIMSCNIWDLMQKEKKGDRAVVQLSKFERFKTIKRFITFGCNMPLFTLSQRKPVPVKLPAGCRWHNYYDPDDALGWPLKPINNLFDKAVYEDKAINVGGGLTSWNPLSHIGYWTDNNFTKPVTNLICREL